LTIAEAGSGEEQVAEKCCQFRTCRAQLSLQLSVSSSGKRPGHECGMGMAGLRLKVRSGS